MSRLGPKISLGAMEVRDLRVEWRPSGPGMILVEVSFLGLDVRRSHPRRLTFISGPISIDEPDESKASYAMIQAREALSHEIDEWFLVDGALVTDPHPELRPVGVGEEAWRNRLQRGRTP